MFSNQLAIVLAASSVKPSVSSSGMSAAAAGTVTPTAAGKSWTLTVVGYFLKGVTFSTYYF